MDKPFDRITILLDTTKPKETDEDSEARSDEVEDIRDYLKIALDSCMPPGWTWKYSGFWE